MASFRMIHISIYLFIIGRCQSENLFELPINIERYRNFHFAGNEEPVKNDFYASIQSINNRLGSSTSDMYLLANEVVLIRNALSENEQKSLFNSLVSSIPKALSSVQVDEGLCPDGKCTLHTWKLNETLNELNSKRIQTVGEGMYSKAASFLQIQQTIRTKNTIDKSLHCPPIHQRPSFKYVHGVMYDINDSLGFHHDKTWSAHQNSSYEWVISISLGHSAVFRYRKDEKEATTEIVLNSGDVLFFNGAALEHAMPYILKDKYPIWWTSVDTSQKARLNIQYRVLGEEDFQQQNTDVIRSSTRSLNSEMDRNRIVHCAASVTTLGDNKFLTESHGNTVSFGAAWMKRIFDLAQPTEAEKSTSMSSHINVTGFGTILRNYWPFTLHEHLNNQRLAILGMRGLNTQLPNDNGLLKKLFYECLLEIQKLPISVEANGIVMSFLDPNLIISLHIAGVLQNPADFDSTFSSKEIIDIKQLVSQAMTLINETDAELYLCIMQSVTTLAFYKYVDPGYIGGTISSIIGVIWLDPIALVKSAIRQQMRNYDKSFHAAHVATGLVAFLSKAGYIQRATDLVANLRSSIADLETVSIHTGVLSTSGRTVLQALQNFFYEGDEDTDEINDILPDADDDNFQEDVLYSSFPDNCEDETTGIEAMKALDAAFSPSTVQERRPLLIYIHDNKNCFNYLLDNYIVWPWDITHQSNKTSFIEFWQQIFPYDSIENAFENQYPTLIGIQRLFENKDKLSTIEYGYDLFKESIWTRNKNAATSKLLLEGLMRFREETNENEQSLSMNLMSKVGGREEIIFEIMKYLSFNDAINAFSPNIIPLFRRSKKKKLPMVEHSTMFIEMLLRKIDPTQIVSLQLRSEDLILNQTKPQLSIYNSVRSISFVNFHNVNEIIRNVMSLKYLTCVSLWYDSEIAFHVISTISGVFQQTIKQLKIHCAGALCAHGIGNDILDNFNQNYSIEYLTVDMSKFAAVGIDSCSRNYPSCLLMMIVDLIKRMNKIRCVDVITNRYNMKNLLDVNEWKRIIEYQRTLAKVTLRVVDMKRDDEEILTKIDEIQTMFRHSIDFRVVFSSFP
ncbi:hypothetical protein I4U23_012209 [Adineta vaga]|nr:hypothetical protein I4U23_012209 [Adineta vaga]